MKIKGTSSVTAAAATPKPGSMIGALLSFFRRSEWRTGLLYHWSGAM